MVMILFVSDLISRIRFKAQRTFVSWSFAQAQAETDVPFAAAAFSAARSFSRSRATNTFSLISISVGVLRRAKIWKWAYPGTDWSRCRQLHTWPQCSPQGSQTRSSPSPAHPTARGPCSRPRARRPPRTSRRPSAASRCRHTRRRRRTIPLRRLRTGQRGRIVQAWRRRSWARRRWPPSRPLLLRLLPPLRPQRRRREVVLGVVFVSGHGPVGRRGSRR